MSQTQNAIIDLKDNNQTSPPSYSECFENETNNTNNKGKENLV
jgi:hypothetical protein